MQSLIAEKFTTEELELLVKDTFGTRLDRIVSMRSNHDFIVFELIGWAERQGKINKLLRGVYLARHDDEEIKAMVREAGLDIDNPAPPQEG